MKYYIISFLLHSLLLGLVIFKFPSPRPNFPQSIEVELLSMPAPVTASVSKNTAMTKAQTIVRKQLKKKAVLAESKVKNTQSLEQQVAQSGAGPSQKRLSYVHELKNYIESHKHYPRHALRLKQRGIVKIRLEIAADGTFKRVSILEPSSFETLNKAAVDLVSGLKKFKPLPKNLLGTSEFVVPIAYQLRKYGS